MKRLMVMALLVLIQGCASIGQDFTLEDANKIRNGMTRDEVVTIMKGQKPYQVTNDSFTYLYSRANGMTGSHSARKFTVLFDENGKVKNAPEIGYFGEAMKYQGERPL